MKGLISFLLTVVLACGLVACSDRSETPSTSKTDGTKIQVTGSLSEAAPPRVIQQLSQSLDIYQPQVTISSPQADQILQDTTVSVQLQVQDLPIFQDPDLGMGPHLEVILDNEPYTMVYDLARPLVFPDLAPGTHTLRVIASTPWHESFKNEGAYAQTTFHIFTKTTDNNPDPALPLLTYSRPTGSYGAEPIMLDFYLTNAPLHLVAQENPDDEIADWRIRATVNGQTFVLDRWQSIYLKGFKPGKNWVQLEFLDEQGNPVKNVFNNTVRLIDYQPKGKDTLSKLVRGELSAVAARGIVDPNYKTNPTPIPTPSASPVETPTPIPSVTPSVEEEPTPPALPEEPTPAPEPTPTEAQQSEQPKSGGFFGRFRRPTETPTPSSVPVVPEEAPTPEPEATVTPSESPAPVEELPPTGESIPTAPPETQKPKSGGFFGRFRRPTEAPASLPKVSQELEVPSPEATEVTPPEPSVVPSQPPAAVEEPVTPVPAPVIKPVPVPIQKKPEVTETPSEEPGAAKPKLNLKEILRSPSVTPSPTIIPAPDAAQSEIPARFLKKTAPNEPAEVLSEPSTANSDKPDASVTEEATPEFP